MSASTGSPMFRSELKIDSCYTKNSRQTASYTPSPALCFVLGVNSAIVAHDSAKKYWYVVCENFGRFLVFKVDTKNEEKPQRNSQKPANWYVPGWRLHAILCSNLLLGHHNVACTGIFW